MVAPTNKLTGLSLGAVLVEEGLMRWRWLGWALKNGQEFGKLVC